MTKNRAKTRVLILDDGDLHLETATCFVNAAGFEAIAAVNEKEALYLLETIAGIQAAFIDIDIPGLSGGLSLATELLRRWPTVKIIFALSRKTPYISDIPEKFYFLSKPYSFHDVLDALNDLPNKHTCH